MDSYQKQASMDEVLLPLRLVLDYYFSEFLAADGVDLAKDTVKVASIIIEQLVFYRGDTERMKNKLQGLFPGLMAPVVWLKFFKDSEEIESVRKLVREKDSEIARVRLSFSSAMDKIEQLTSEKSELMKKFERQKRILLALQDRLDGVVINSGQQIG